MSQLVHRIRHTCGANGLVVTSPVIREITCVYCLRDGWKEQQEAKTRADQTALAAVDRVCELLDEQIELRAQLVALMPGDAGHGV